MPTKASERKVRVEIGDAEPFEYAYARPAQVGDVGMVPQVADHAAALINAHRKHAMLLRGRYLDASSVLSREWW